MTLPPSATGWGRRERKVDREGRCKTPLPDWPSQNQSLRGWHVEEKSTARAFTHLSHDALTGVKSDSPCSPPTSQQMESQCLHLQRRCPNVECPLECTSSLVPSSWKLIELPDLSHKASEKEIQNLKFVLQNKNHPFKNAFAAVPSDDGFIA